MCLPEWSFLSRSACRWIQRFCWRILGLILLVVLLVSLAKALIFGGITRAFGYRDAVPIAVGLGLFQVGEFAFVLARVGAGGASVSADIYALVLATALVTMILTPFATRATQPLAAWIGRGRAIPAPDRSEPIEGLTEHIIIAGYGRVGRYTAELLKNLGLPFVVIELDDHINEQARAAGIPVIYGDAGSPVVLEAAGVHTARLLLITVSAAIDVELIARQVQHSNPALHMVARAARRAQIELLRGLGVHEVVEPEFEAGLGEMVRQTLLHFGIAAAEIERLSDTVRDELYQPFQNPHSDTELLNRLRHARQTLEIEWFTLAADAPLVGHSIGNAAIRRQTGALIVSLIRDDTIQHNPAPELALAGGDSLAVLGTPDQRAAFRALLAPEAAAGDGVAMAQGVATLS